MPYNSKLLEDVSQGVESREGDCGDQEEYGVRLMLRDLLRSNERGREEDVVWFCVDGWRLVALVVEAEIEETVLALIVHSSSLRMGALLTST